MHGIYIIFRRGLNGFLGFGHGTSAGAGFPKLLLTKENCQKEILTRGRQF
jgi:hypothetical protein